MNDLLAWTIDAHGGMDRWNKISAIRMHGQMGGLGLLHSDYESEPVRLAHISINEPVVLVSDYPRPGQGMTGYFSDKLVRIDRLDKTIVRSRNDPRNAFLKYMPRFVRWFWYDDLDVAYFIGYALWNYFLTPFLFARPGFEVSELEPIRKFGHKLRVLNVKFPPDIPTHSPEQTFFINERGLISYFEYSVDIVGPWVKATHFCRSYRDFPGIKVATRRRVVLRHDHILRNWRIRRNIATLMWGNLRSIEFVDDVPPVAQ